MVLSTTIYGSGQKNGAKAETLPDTEEDAKVDSAMVQAQNLLKNPLTAPLAPLAMFIATMQKGGGIGGPMPARDFSPWGSLVQETSTDTLNKKNIFGAGGSN